MQQGIGFATTVAGALEIGTASLSAFSDPETSAFQDLTPMVIGEQDATRLGNMVRLEESGERYRSTLAEQTKIPLPLYLDMFQAIDDSIHSDKGRIRLTVALITQGWLRVAVNNVLQRYVDIYETFPAGQKPKLDEAIAVQSFFYGFTTFVKNPANIKCVEACAKALALSEKNRGRNFTRFIAKLTNLRHLTPQEIQAVQIAREVLKPGTAFAQKFIDELQHYRPGTRVLMKTLLAHAGQDFIDEIVLFLRCSQRPKQELSERAAAQLVFNYLRARFSACGQEKDPKELFNSAMNKFMQEY